MHVTVTEMPNKTFTIITLSFWFPLRSNDHVFSGK